MRRATGRHTGYRRQRARLSAGDTSACHPRRTGQVRDVLVSRSCQASQGEYVPPGGHYRRRARLAHPLGTPASRAGHLQLRGNEPLSPPGPAHARPGNLVIFLEPAATSFGSARDLANALRRAEAAHGEYENRPANPAPTFPPWYPHPPVPPPNPPLGTAP